MLLACGDARGGPSTHSGSASPAGAVPPAPPFVLGAGPLPPLSLGAVVLPPLAGEGSCSSSKVLASSSGPREPHAASDTAASDTAASDARARERNQSGARGTRGD